MDVLNNDTKKIEISDEDFDDTIYDVFGGKINPVATTAIICFFAFVVFAVVIFVKVF